MPLEFLVGRLWRLRWRVVLLAVLLLSAGAAIVLAWPRSHVAEALVAPSETTGIATSSLLSPSPAFSGLLDPRPTGNFAIYLGALRSAEAAMLLAESTPLLADLAARRAEGPAGALRRLLGLRMETDLDDARAWLERNLAVTQTLGAVTWTLQLAHPDRERALDALRRLHAFAEAKVRADLADMARRRIAALEARLARESDLYIRQSLYEMLAQQQRVGLVVAADEAVAARLVSAPIVDQRPSLPNRPLLLALLLVVAPMAALGLVAAGILLAGPGPVAVHPAYRLEAAE
ncbi:hypothetical protein [Falsiroseomonas tokyonensis]|uniref:Polysaccharide chain length determinant N-terminal domain-containing protein n=1 Tax=Falsiroseomonas tokyonensis TaxID=430521 RepID=A0ABV7BNU8_9PROT|nr:hypothetical protein [Falsiroseomonas tokyonensis]MBU8537209.1 hypothetical protein [Falsiroseomonas tokyonensis]